MSRDALKSSLFHAAVLLPLRDALDQLGAKYPGPGGPPVLRARRIAKEAREAGDTDSETEAIGLLSDTFLLRGDTARSLDILDGRDPQRQAVIRALAGEDVSGQLAEHALGSSARAGLCGILLARQSPPSRPGVASTFDRELTAQQRARLQLAAAVVHAEGGRRDDALREALVCQASSEKLGDKSLEGHARDVVSHILGGLNDTRVDQLVQLALELGYETRLQPVLDHVATSTLSMVGAQRAFVLLGDGDELTVAASAFEPGHSGNPSLSIARAALTRGRETVTHDTGGKAVSESIEALQLRMVICIPMADRSGVMGAIYADSTAVSTEELEQIAWVLRAFAAQATVAVRQTRLLGEASVRAQNAREVVHDVKNVANGMRLGLDEFEDLDLPDWASASLRDVRAMNAMLLDTMRPLLDDRQPEPREIRLDALAERAGALLRFDAQHRGLTFLFKVEPVVVLGVEEDLARVMANVLGNALKYTPKGGTVRVQVAQRDGVCAIAVADQGPGIPEEDLERIFDTGVQAEGSKAGFGLGLGICRRIVTGHGGRIRARNGAQGAVFTIVLPIVGA